MRFFNRLIYLAALLFVGCTQNEPTLSSSLSDKIFVENEIETLMMDHKVQNLSKEDALNLAKIFHSRDLHPQSLSRSLYYSIYDNAEVETIYDDNSVPLLYIVNWTSNKGFVIISASKNTSPILAYSEEGNFDINENDPSYSFLKNYMKQVQTAMQDTSDSLRIKNAIEWAMFEKQADTPSASRASSSEIDAMILKEIAAMQAKGHRYIGKISEAANYLPPDEYYALCMDVMTHTDPAYNYEDVSLFFLSSQDIKVYGPLIGTRWEQVRAPFGPPSPNRIAGCVTIAIGQIAYYHKYPTRYRWDQMPTEATNIRNAAVEMLIREILSYCSPIYTSTSTGITTSDAGKILKKLGYSISAGVPSFDGLRDNIIAGKPVYIDGHNDEVGHAWVCEGYQHRRWKGVISMIGTEQASLGDHDFDPTVSPYMHYGFSPYPPDDLKKGTPQDLYYMNLGKPYGNSNGWYNYNTASYDNPEIDYYKNQHVYYISKP